MSLNIIIKKRKSKNQIYKEAKDLKKKFREGMLNHTEMNRPTEANINKCIHFDRHHTTDVIDYRNKMSKLDEDPSVRNTEKLRRHW